jgi:hypothetical protein
MQLPDSIDFGKVLGLEALTRELSAALDLEKPGALSIGAGGKQTDGTPGDPSRQIFGKVLATRGQSLKERT